MCCVEKGEFDITRLERHEDGAQWTMDYDKVTCWTDLMPETWQEELSSHKQINICSTLSQDTELSIVN